MNYDDAFTLEMVSDSLVDKFNHVAGIVPVLTTHLTQVYMYMTLLVGHVMWLVYVHMYMCTSVCMDV